MGEHPVGQRQARFASGHRAAESGKVRELAEGAGEGRLAALVRPGHHQHAFGAGEAERISHHRHTFDEQAEVLGVLGVDRGATDGEGGQARRGVESAEEGQVVQIELDLAIEGDQVRGEKVGVVAGEFGQVTELGGVQGGDLFEDLFVHVVRLDRTRCGVRSAGRTGTEAGEQVRDGGAVVGGVARWGHLHRAVHDPQVVAHLIECPGQRSCVGGQAGELGTSDVGDEVLPPTEQRAGRERHGVQCLGRARDGIDVVRGGPQVAAVPLERMLEKFSAGSQCADTPHPVGELLEDGQDGVVGEILEHLSAVAQLVRVEQWPCEPVAQCVGVRADQGGEDAIEIEVLGDASGHGRGSGPLRPQHADVRHLPASVGRSAPRPHGRERLTGRQVNCGSGLVGQGRGRVGSGLWSDPTVLTAVG